MSSRSVRKRIQTRGKNTGQNGKSDVIYDDVLKVDVSDFFPAGKAVEKIKKAGAYDALVNIVYGTLLEGYSLEALYAHVVAKFGKVAGPFTYDEFCQWFAGPYPELLSAYSFSRVQAVGVMARSIYTAINTHMGSIQAAKLSAEMLKSVQNNLVKQDNAINVQVTQTQKTLNKLGEALGVVTDPGIVKEDNDPVLIDSIKAQDGDVK